MKFFSALTIVFLLVGHAGAAILDLQATVVAVDPLSFAVLVPQPDLSVSPQPARTLQVDLAFEVSDFSAGERNFANMAFDVTLAPGVTDLFNWIPNTDTFPAGPPGPAGDLAAWATNLDAGASSTDLQGILASIAGSLSEGDPRSNLGESGPQGVGQLFLEWDGMTPGVVSFDNLLFSMVNDGGLIDPASQSVGPTIQLGAIPEPASIALAGLGLVSLLGLRIHRNGQF